MTRNLTQIHRAYGKFIHLTFLRVILFLSGRGLIICIAAHNNIGASGTGNTTSIFSQIAEKIAETAINSVPSKTSTSGNTVNTDEAAAPSKTSNNFLANLFSRLTSKSNASSSAIIASNEEQIVTSEIQSNSNLFARKTLSVKPATGISTSSNSDQRPSMIGNTIGTAGTSAEDLAENDSIMKMDEDQDSTQEESESFDEYDDSENPEDLSAGNSSVPMIYLLLR